MPTIAIKQNNLIALLLLGMAGAFLAHMSWQGEIVGLVADDAVYILLADYFSPYSYEIRNSAAFVARHGVFPPGYPLYLALFGAGSQHIYYAHVLTTLVIVAAFGVSARYFILSGQKFAMAVVYIAILFFLPRTLFQNLELLSEPLYLLFSMLALAKVESLKDDRDVRGLCWIAIFISAATLTRTAGIALLFAFIAWHFAHAKKNVVWRAVLLAIVPLLVWEALKTVVYAQSKSYTQELLNTYNWHAVAALLRKAVENFSTLWAGWRTYIDVNTQFSSLPASILLPVCALPALLVRLARFRLDAIYFTLYLGMILVWPFPDHTPRFLYPIMPLAIFYVLQSICWLRDKKWRVYAHVLLLGLTLLAAAPSTAQIVYKAIKRDDLNLGVFAKTSALYKYSAPLNTSENSVRILHELTKAMEISGKLIPKNECVYATHFEMFMYFGKHYARPATDLLGVASGALPECKYLLVNWSTTHRSFHPGYPLNESSLDTALIYSHMAHLPDTPHGKKVVVAQMLQLLPLLAETPRSRSTEQK